jgi:hypothetical protein
MKGFERCGAVDLVLSPTRAAARDLHNEFNSQFHLWFCIAEFFTDPLRESEFTRIGLSDGRVSMYKVTFFR